MKNRAVKNRFNEIFLVIQWTLLVCSAYFLLFIDWRWGIFALVCTIVLGHARQQVFEDWS